MKKFFFLCALILGASELSTAGEISLSPTQSSSSTLPAPSQVNNAKPETVSTVDFSQQNSKKKKKKKMKPWEYVVGGVLVVLIVILSIVAPNGYNSRTGI